MVPCGIFDHSYQDIPHYSPVSSSASLRCCSHIVLILFLFHFSTTCLFLLVVPTVSECLEWSQECYAPLVHYGTRQGSSQAWSPPPQYLHDDRLWLSQGSSLSGAYGASLLVISGCLLTHPTQVAPCKGHLSWAHCCLELVVPDRILLVSSLLPILRAGWACRVPDWWLSQACFS